MLTFFDTEVIQIKRKTLTGADDALGNPVVVSSLITVNGVIGRLRGGEVNAATGSTVTDEYRVVLNTNIELYEDDRFIIRGDEWVMDSDVQFTPAFGSAFLNIGKVIDVKRVVKNG